MSWFSDTASLDIHLSAARVWIRPPQSDDWPAWAALRTQSRDFLQPWEPTWPTDSLSKSTWQRRLARQYHDWKNDASYSFLAFSSETGAMVGGLNLSYVRRGVAQMAMLGYWVGHPYARQGYISGAVPLLCRFAFDTLGLHRLEAGCLPRNTASCGLLRKAGFQPEGIARHYLKINGIWEDHLIFSKLQTD